MALILILVLLNICVKTDAIIAYDCGSQALNVTTHSLLNIAECDIPTPQVKVSKVQAQLLQVEDFTETEVIACKVTIDRTIVNCGAYSHQSLVSNGVGEYVKEIQKHECLDMIRYKKYLYNSNDVADNLKMNDTTVRTAVLAGTFTNDGTCSGAGYSNSLGSWKNVAVQAKIKISLRTHIARISLEHNKIFLSTGTVCMLNEGSCLDADSGYSFWELLPKASCTSAPYASIFDGIIDRVEEENNKNKEVVYSFNSKEITFSFMIIGEDHICGAKIYRTEHPSLVIMEQNKNSIYYNPKKISTSNLDIFTYVNSKFVYVERYVRSQVKKMYHNILVQQCEIEKKLLHNSLALATIAPDQFAYALKKKPGYMAFSAGEVIHILKCVPVEVKIVGHSDLCYADVQVAYKNKTHYMTPKTHIIKQSSTVIDCNNILAPQFFIEGDWYKMLKTPQIAKTPNILRPYTRATWSYENPEHLARSGIYSERDLAAIKDTIMFPMEKSSVINEFAKEANMNPDMSHENMLLRLLDEATMDKIVDSYWSKIWKSFTSFGTFSAGFITILIIFQFFKQLVEILLNGIALHRIYGVSIHLFAAIWSSITHLLLSIAHADMRSYQYDDISERDIERSDNTTLPVDADYKTRLQIESEKIPNSEIPRPSAPEAGLYPNITNKSKKTV